MKVVIIIASKIKPTVTPTVTPIIRLLSISPGTGVTGGTARAVNR
jgi:hypothetical protein